MCYCWWQLYGFSQTSQNTLVVLGPAETKQNIFQTNITYTMKTKHKSSKMSPICCTFIQLWQHFNTHHSLLDRRVAAKAPPQTPDFSGPLWHWPGACGFLSPSASSRFAFASFRSLSFEYLPVTEACTPRDPLGTAKQNKHIYKLRHPPWCPRF